LHRLRQWPEAATVFEKAIAMKPDYVEAHSELGNTYRAIGALDKAVKSYRQALTFKPNYVEGFNNLGVALKEQGKESEAISAYQEALRLNPSHAEARCNLGQIQKDQGQLDEAMTSFEEAIHVKPEYSKAHHGLGLVYLWKERLDLAFPALRRSADLTYNHGHPLALQPVYKSRIKHDTEQIQYLFEKGIVGPEYTTYLEALRQLYQKTNEISSPSLKMVLTQEEWTRISPSFNRILHYADCPVLPHGALNPNLDVEEIERRYSEKKPEILYVDSLLVPEALQSLRTFCRESTIWKVDYENGYIGTLLGEGFSSPLLLQISEELRLRFPNIFQDHRLMQSWAFKQDSQRTGLNIHADAAAVNVNFWITENEANQDPSSGGLVVWDKEAPKEWDFKVYNGTTFKPKIFEFLKESGAQGVMVPYRANRALIFNSDLFHETDRCAFRDGYENRRINITMLYGRRASTWSA
jgi:tetratricopeptide (TPR) repeat protein